MATRRRPGAGAAACVGGTRTSGRVTLPRRSSSGRVIKENLKYGRPHALYERIYDPEEQSRDNGRGSALKSLLQLESLSELPDFREQDISSCVVCCAPCGRQPLLAATLSQLSQILNSSAEHPANLLSSVLNFDVSQLSYDQIMCNTCANLFSELHAHERQMVRVRNQLFGRMTMSAQSEAGVNTSNDTAAAAAGNSAVNDTVSRDAAVAVGDAGDASEGNAAPPPPAAAAGGHQVDQVDSCGGVLVPAAAELLADHYSGSMLGLTAFAPPAADDGEDDDEEEEEDDDVDEDEELEYADGEENGAMQFDTSCSAAAATTTTVTGSGGVTYTTVANIEDVERQLSSFIEISHEATAPSPAVAAGGDGGGSMIDAVNDQQMMDDLIVMHTPTTGESFRSSSSWSTSAAAAAGADGTASGSQSVVDSSSSLAAAATVASSTSAIEPPQLPCPLCPQIFLTEPERRAHTAQHMNDRLQCELCSETVVRKRMPAHRATHGAVVQLPAAAADASQLETATAAAADVVATAAASNATQQLSPYACAFCHKGFESQARLNVHVKIRHGRPSLQNGGASRRPRGRPRRTDLLAPRPGTCQYCGVYIKVDLQGHVNRFHTMVRPFECTTCGLRLVSRHALAEHRQVFHSEGHRCELCGMMFARKKQLSVHAWKRHAIGGVTCRVCGKAFARSDTLDGHMRCHQRPLACHLCPARFPFKRELRNHQHLRHGLHGEVAADNDYLPGEAYRCAKCGRCYGSWAARDRHVCDAAGGGALCDLFVCQLCGDWSTRYEGDMVKHMRNLHNIDADTILIADVDQTSGEVHDPATAAAAAAAAAEGAAAVGEEDEHGQMGLVDVGEAALPTDGDTNGVAGQILAEDEDDNESQQQQQQQQQEQQQDTSVTIASVPC